MLEFKTLETYPYREPHEPSCMSVHEALDDACLMPHLTGAMCLLRGTGLHSALRHMLVILRPESACH